MAASVVRIAKGLDIRTASFILQEYDAGSKKCQAGKQLKMRRNWAEKQEVISCVVSLLFGGFRTSSDMIAAICYFFCTAPELESSKNKKSSGGRHVA